MKKLNILTFLLLVFIPNIVFGADEWANAIITIIDGIFDLWAVLIWLFSIVAGFLISPEFITWEVFWMDVVMRDIWVLVSNVVYLAFWFIIVFVAFMNIISMEGENYNLKTALPKIIIWVLIVPFSFFIVQFVISFSSILAASVMQLPQTSFWVDTGPIQSTEICYKPEIVLTWSESSWFCSTEWDSYKTIWDIFNDGPFGLISIYTYDIFAFHNLVKIWQVWTYTTIWDLSSLWINLLFKMIFFIAYFFLILALILALFVRMIWLWLYVMFSPLFWLLFFFWDQSDWIVKTFNFKDFIWLAMIPVYVAWALSFWIYFVKSIDHSMMAWETKEVTTSEYINSWKADEKYYSCQPWRLFHITVAQPWTDSTTPNQSICFWWKPILTVHGNFFWTAADEWTWVIWTVFVNALALFIVWMTIMIALRSSEITKWIIEPIYNLWENIWTFVAQSPKHLPVIPWLPSLKALENASNAPWAALASKNAQDAMPVRNFFENLNNPDPINETLNNLKQTWKYVSVDSYNKSQMELEKSIRDNSLSSSGSKDAIKQHAKNVSWNANILEEIWATQDKLDKTPELAFARWDVLTAELIKKGDARLNSPNNWYETPQVWVFNIYPYAWDLDEWTVTWDDVKVVKLTTSDVEHDINISFNSETWRVDLSALVWTDVRRTYGVLNEKITKESDMSKIVSASWDLKYDFAKWFGPIRDAIGSKYTDDADIKKILENIIWESMSLSSTDASTLAQAIIDDK